MAANFGLIWLVIGLPVAGFLIQALIGKQDCRKWVWQKRWQASWPLRPDRSSLRHRGLSDHVAHLNLRAALSEVVAPGWDWINIAGLNIPFELRVDPLTMLMTLIITGVGALIHLYATGYMGEEKDYTRFFTYLNLFIAAMLILVLGNNLVMLFIGWEGVWSLLLPPDRLLVQGPRERQGREQGVHRQPHRRLGVDTGHVPALRGR